MLPRQDMWHLLGQSICHIRSPEPCNDMGVQSVNTLPRLEMISLSDFDRRSSTCQDRSVSSMPAMTE
ncbi:hypothetical protein VTN96DRAFT_2040 [Rasamsonia emersonii]